MTSMRLSLLTLILLIPILSHATGKQANDPIDVLLENNIIRRDSGQEITREYLAGCLKTSSQSRYIIECDDVNFKYYISCFIRSENNLPIVLITEDGASVENRWVYEVRGNEYIDIKNKIWPNITGKMVSDLLIQQTGDDEYTERYVLSVAHSSYRVSHSSTDVLIVYSGIPDKSWKTKLGELKWDGHEFKFFPEHS